MIRKMCIIISMVLCETISYAQNRTIHQSIIFSDFLMSNKLYDDCTFLLKQTKSQPGATSLQKDTLSFSLGLVFYKRNLPDSSVISFSDVSESSTLFNESRLYKSYIFSNENKYTESLNSVMELKCTSDEDIANKQLYNAGISLLIRDTAQFKHITDSFPKASKEIDMAVNNLISLNERIRNVKRKSGLLAGAMSAIIPGAGKIYAGKIRQGLATFIPVVLMGAQVFEAGKVGKIKSLRFLIYSGLFSVFYVGNIWGSVLSVSVCRSEFNREINDQILLNLRIPVRKLFR